MDIQNRCHFFQKALSPLSSTTESSSGRAVSGDNGRRPQRRSYGLSRCDDPRTYPCAFSQFPFGWISFRHRNTHLPVSSLAAAKHTCIKSWDRKAHQVIRQPPNSYMTYMTRLLQRKSQKMLRIIGQRRLQLERRSLGRVKSQAARTERTLLPTRIAKPRRRKAMRRGRQMTILRNRRQRSRNSKKVESSLHMSSNEMRLTDAKVMDADPTGSRYQVH